MTSALDLTGDFAAALTDALASHRAGRLDEAEAIYLRLLAGSPGHPTLLNLYGALTLASGRPDLAERLLRRAIAADPAEPNYHCNLGEALRRMNRLDAAIDAYRQAIALNPSLAMAHNNLGIALAASDRLPEAFVAYAEAMRLAPGHAQAWSNFGNALRRSGQLAAAIAACRTAVKLKPDNAEIQNDLGAALAADERFDDAINAYQKARRLNPDHGDALTNLGNAFSAVARHADAIDAGECAVAAAPDSVQAHWNLAVSLLRAGEWRRGWVEYEWRWKRMPMRFSEPLWDGVARHNQIVLLHAEQGFGDSIQFARFLPIVASQIATAGGRLIVECAAPLNRLSSTLRGVGEVCAAGESLPHFHAHLPFMSLGRVLDVTPHSIPGDVPYLTAATMTPRRKDRRQIGVCFTGSRTHHLDRLRSIADADTHPLFTADAAFHHLHPAIDPALTDFAATAARIASLDLVISVDTAVAHLAGAMGKPTWILLPAVADWRWLTGSATTPWYPTAKLIRQSPGEAWRAVIERVRTMLDRSLFPDRPTAQNTW